MTQAAIRLLAVALLVAGCAQQPAAIPPAPLLETYWRAAEIEGVPYTPRPGVREAHLLLSDGRVTGFTGCNNLTGRYEHDTARLTFKPPATTRMACLPDSDIEQRFLSALNATGSYRISGSMLVLIDGAGKTRMRLLARRGG